MCIHVIDHRAYMVQKRGVAPCPVGIVVRDWFFDPRSANEALLGPRVETEFDRQLRARIEAGRRRVAQWREREGISVSDQDRENLSGLSETEILHRGRARVARAKAERDAVQRDIANKGGV